MKVIKPDISPLLIGEGSWKSKRKLALSFFAGQGSVQLLSVFSSLLLIRWLSLNEYAQYSFAFAVQSTAQVLIEVGISGSIVTLVGSRIHDKKVIGSYIAAGKYIRSRLYILVSVACVIAFPLMTFHQHWSFITTVLLLLSIIISLNFSGAMVYYISPLKIHRRLREIYLVQVKSSMVRLLALAALASINTINAWIATLTTSFTIWYNGRQFRKKAEPFVEEPKVVSPAVTKEMIRYVRPVMPGIIYSAFSAQIALFIISIFGRSENIAEVGALSRLGQLFLILNAASSTLVVPFLAKQPAHTVITNYVKLMGLALTFVIAISFFTFLFPEPLLLILGDKYSHLGNETGLLVLNSGILLLNTLMWDMNCSRRWLWSWISLISISSNIIVQVILVIGMDLSTAFNVLVFSIIVSLTSLLNKIIVAIIGFNKTRNEINLLPASA